MLCAHVCIAPHWSIMPGLLTKQHFAPVRHKPIRPVFIAWVFECFNTIMHTDVWGHEQVCSPVHAQRCELMWGRWVDFVSVCSRFLHQLDGWAGVLVLSGGWGGMLVMGDNSVALTAVRCHQGLLGLKSISSRSCLRLDWHWQIAGTLQLNGAECTPGALLYACGENMWSQFKGFAELLGANMVGLLTACHNKAVF